ncbi:MAG: RNA polymerase sigma-70 factor [Tepidiformaceae bacterium]
MAAIAEADVQEFEEQRPLLFGVAYRMLGSATEAEDIVQDAYLRYQAVPREEVRNDRSYLVTIVSRLCLDHLKSARVQRERYVGPWLPEPVLTGDDDWRISPEGLIDLRESVSMAFLVMLESLGPVERAVLLLHDVFDYSHAEVGQVVRRSETACRQVLKRARERLAERRPRHVPSLDHQSRLTQQFLSAAATGDIDGLLAALAQDAIAYSDGGGKVAAALNPIYGADKVARFVCVFPKKEQTDRIEVHEVNGQPALLTWLGRHLTNVVLLSFEGDQVVTFYAQRNPDKLRRLRRALTAATPRASH